MKTKNELKEALDARGIQYAANASVATLQALLDGSDKAATSGEATATVEHVAEYTTVLPRRKPIRDTGWTLPTITVPCRLVVGRKDDKGNELALPKSGDKEIVPLTMGNNRFVQWNENLQGNMEMEQERLNKAGIGIQIYKVEGDNFVLDSNLEWTCSRAGLKVNA